MIQKCYFESSSLAKQLELSFNNDSDSTQINLIKRYDGKASEVSFYMKFEKNIKVFRTQLYTWQKPGFNQNVISPHSSKIIVFENEIHAISAQNIGSWEILDEKTIKWTLKSDELTPLFNFNNNASKSYIKSFEVENYHLKILYTKDKVPEFSRSKIPFKPIVCFTDHCDFDNVNLLKKQLEFLRRNNVKISKGFFLNHFSKNPYNCSYENDEKLLNDFDADGHELFYHSLTEKRRDKTSSKLYSENKESINEFVNFRPPKLFSPSTYVDYGYQPYNFTRIKNFQMSDAEWSSIIIKKGIKNLWSYTDAGEAERGIINQLNPQHFTLDRIFKKKIYKGKYILKSLLYYNGDEELHYKYSKLTTAIKLFIKLKNIISIFNIIKYLIPVIIPIIKLLLIKKNRKKPFKYNRLSPFIFRHKIGGEDFNFFQSVSVTDFETVFSKNNIDLLIEESGAIIVHCYFTDPFLYHSGRIFDGDEISNLNEINFKYLKEKIELKQIWNPTINELIEFTNKTANINFYMDKDENLIRPNIENVPIRYIKAVHVKKD